MLAVAVPTGALSLGEMVHTILRWVRVLPARVTDTKRLPILTTHAPRVIDLEMNLGDGHLRFPLGTLSFFRAYRPPLLVRLRRETLPAFRPG